MTEYGGEIGWEPILDATGRQCGIRCVHVGPDLHDTIPPGEQCRCGALATGIIRQDPPGKTNDFARFAEEWEHVSEAGFHAYTWKPGEFLPLERGRLDVGIWLDHEPSADELAEIRGRWADSGADEATIRVSWPDGATELNL